MSADGSGYFARLSQCVGKEPFSTPQIAKKVQRRRATRRGAGRAKQHVYHCRHCGLFHIGTPTKSVHASPKRARWAVDEDTDHELTGA